jgi:hypothetical protein
MASDVKREQRVETEPVVDLPDGMPLQTLRVTATTLVSGKPLRVLVRPGYALRPYGPDDAREDPAPVPPPPADNGLSFRLDDRPPAPALVARGSRHAPVKPMSASAMTEGESFHGRDFGQKVSTADATAAADAF